MGVKSQFDARCGGQMGVKTDAHCGGQMGVKSQFDARCGGQMGVKTDAQCGGQMGVEKQCGIRPGGEASQERMSNSRRPRGGTAGVGELRLQSQAQATGPG